MRELLTVLMLATGVLAAPATDTSECGCSVEAYIDDRDTTGTNLRDAPKGKVIAVLHPSREDVGTIGLDIDCSRDNWLRVSDNLGQRGWIFSGLMKMGTRNYDQSDIKLFAKPDTLSAVSGVLTGESEVTVRACKGAWAHIEFKNAAGRVVKGWLRPDMQCASPVTNCN